MGTFFAYSIQSAICLAMFYLFYKVLLSRETFHRFNRAALLGILVLSLIIPFAIALFPINLFALSATSILIPDTQSVFGDFSLAAGRLPDVVKKEDGNVFLALLLLVYLIGCILYLLYVILSIVRIGIFIRRGTLLTNDNGIKIILMEDKNFAPFSWMNYIALSQSDYEEAGATIIAHEKEHFRLHHSYDLIIAQICIITQWFNPAAWLLYRELQNIHEFEADDAVIRTGIEAKQYQLLLIKKAVGARLYSMANSFNHSNLKKRITMMLQKKSNSWARLKYAYVLPLAAVAVALFAHPEISQPFEEISSAKVSHFALETSKNEVKDLSEAEISASLSNAAVSANLQDSIFSQVEQAPEFPGGYSALQRFIADTLKYPVEALQKGIQGRVFCKFVIEKDGSVSTIEIAKSVDPLLDAEAVRALKSLPKFEPGKEKGNPVRVSFLMPIEFRIQSNATRSFRQHKSGSSGH